MSACGDRGPTRRGSATERLARELFAAAAQKLAEEFGSVTATAVGTLQGEGPAGEA